MTSVAKFEKMQQVNIVQEKNDTDLTMNNSFVRCIIVVSYLCQVLLLYDRYTFQNYIGLVLTFCVAILMFTDCYYIPIALIILTPNVFGTLFMGRVSFVTVLGVALVFRLLITKAKVNFNISDIVWITIGLCNCLHLHFFNAGHTGIEKIFSMLMAMFWLIYIRIENRKNDGAIEKFLAAMSIAVTTNAAVSLLTRKATLYEHSERLGLIGLGSDDPNIAALAITTAIITLISTNYVKVWAKIVSMLILFLCLITTVSISGFLAVIGTVLIFILFTNKERLNLFAIVSLIIVAILAIVIFPNLSIVGEKNDYGETTNYLEYYQEKIGERFDAFVNDDLDAATSGRTKIMRTNLDYLSEQSTISQLFGGYPTNPLGLGMSHNSYADMILRFGYIGAIGVVMLLVYSTVKCLQKAMKTQKYCLFLCKLLFIYWGMTLSLFDGTTSVLWYSVILMF